METNKINDNQPELWELAYSKVISLSINFIDVGGSVNAGIVLSNLWYWKDKGHDPDGWIYKTQNDWYEETRLTVREMATARKLLRDRGLIEEKKSGIPAKLYYRINRQNLKEKTEALYPQGFSQDRGKRKTRIDKSAKQETLKAQNSDQQKRVTVIDESAKLSSITSNTTTKTNNKERETSEETDRGLSFFSESEPESEQPTEPTENPPLLAETEIKAENKPTPNLQGQEKNQGVSVESENKTPPAPPYYIPSPEKNGKSTIKFPVLGDVDSAPYCQELRFLKFELPDELALGTKEIIQSRKKVFGRQLLCLMNDQGIDPIANLSKFLKFYFDKNLANNSNYKGKEYDSLVQSQTAQAIANKIKDSDHAVLVQTIAEFKKKITKPVETAPQINFSEPIPEGDRYTLPKIDNLFEAQKKRIKQQQAKNKPKMTSLSKNEVSIALESVTASNANLSPNPETFESEYDF